MNTHMLKVKKQYNIFLLIVLTVWSTRTPLHAAKVLTLKDCVNTLKEENIDIKINQLCLPYNPMALSHPLLNFALSIEQPMKSPLFVESTSVLQAGLGSAQLKYSLDLKTFREYKWNKRLNKKEELINKLQKLQDIERILVKTITAYYDLAKSQKEHEYRVASARVAKLAMEEKAEECKIGKISEIDLLEYKLLFQEKELESLNSERDLKKNKRALNLILNQPLDADITVDTAVQEQPDWPLIRQKISASGDNKKDQKKRIGFGNKLSMAIMELQIQRDILSLKSAKSSLFDCIQISIESKYKVPLGLYDISKNVFVPVSQQLHAMQEGQEGVISTNLKLSLNIASLFQGIPRNIKIAKLQIAKDKLEKIKQKAALKSQEEDMRSAYINKQAMRKLQQERVKYMRQKVALQQAKYGVQKCTLLELLAAQNELNADELKLIGYDFDVHLSKFLLDLQVT